MPVPEFILTLRCPDRPGILASVTGYLSAKGADIRDAAQYGDPETEIFFIRIHITSPEATKDELEDGFTPVAKDLGLTWTLHDMSRKCRVLIAVSRHGHCLVDLLHRTSIGALPIEISGVVSNHPDMRSLVEWYSLPYWHLPITEETKLEQEDRIRALIEESGTDLLVLARYMQILSEDFCSLLSGRCINIHHSFLPSFKGARPYAQAYKRGVKLIGATAHYVTARLDGGPIIEQGVHRVTHAASPSELVSLGREVEASVLSRAVRWHAEHRVFISGDRTVVLN